MEESRRIDNEALEKVVGGLLTDEDGNKYYLDYGIDLSQCVCCGECARVCPMQCIEMRPEGAVIDFDNCLRCGCCENSCAVGAIGDNRKIIVKYAVHE